jgi:hypothetical protein
MPREGFVCMVVARCAAEPSLFSLDPIYIILYLCFSLVVNYLNETECACVTLSTWAMPLGNACTY